MTIKFPFIFTFYSFKGGVGRSMALLNVAYCLVGRGRNVLILDMDLEAPGIGRFLRDNEELASEPQKDIIDLLSAVIAAPDSDERKTLAELSAAASPFIAPVKAEKLDVPSLTPRLGVRGRLDVITGRADGDYCTRLDRLRLGQRTQENLVEYGEVLRKYLKGLRIEVPPLPGTENIPGIGPTQEPYDYVLVDSRTGVTEAGGLCLGPLSDRLIVFTGLNHQNVRGTADFLKEIGLKTREWFTKKGDEPWDEAHKPATDASGAPKGLGPKPTLIVASPVPLGDMERQKERIGRASAEIGPVSMKITYHPELGFYETNFVREYPDEPITTEYRRLTDFVMYGAQDHQTQLADRSRKEWEEKHHAAAIDLALRVVPAEPNFGVGLLGPLGNHFKPKSPDEYKAVYGLYSVLTLETTLNLHAALNNWGIALTDQASAKHGAESDRLFALAREKIEAALVVDPESSDALNNWGVTLLLQAMGKNGGEANRLMKLASEKFEATLRMEPDHRGALNNWGIAFSVQAKTSKGGQADRLFALAQEKYEAAIKIKADYYEAINNSGLAFVLKAKTKRGENAINLQAEALKRYDAAIKVSPEHHGASNNKDAVLSWMDSAPLCSMIYINFILR